MVDLLIVLLVAVIVFCLIWYLITILPLPAPLEKIRWVFFAVLIVIAIVYLLQYIT